ncbi:MAG TPA: PQQ-binding-like beta-propeller repeat protein, partial [Streptosporangiaceae bacterium]|nr:PQQ-binding-like beta-propeller repeat protein [Streptosporangiaceae bacterium]
NAPPLVVGPVAVLAQDGTVHGLDLADGHPLWSWAGGQSVYGMWRWGGLVAVLTDQVSNHSRLTGLDAATGAVRWSLRLPAQGLLGGQAATADGGLAMVVSRGVLQVVNLADGRVRWQRRIPASPALAAADGLVIYGVNGRLTGYDDRTGQLRWTARGLPQSPTIQLIAGLALVTSNVQGGADPTALTAVTAVIPATGRIAWRFNPGTPVTVLSAGPAGLTLAIYNPDRLYLLDPRTGRLRWQASTAVALDTIPLVTKTAVFAVEGLLQTVRLVARNAADGRVIWQDTLTKPPLDGQLVAQAGPLAVLQGEPRHVGTSAPLLAYQMASGRLAWQVDMPTFVQSPPVLMPGGILVQPGDLIYTCADRTQSRCRKYDCGSRMNCRHATTRLRSSQVAGRMPQGPSSSKVAPGIAATMGEWVATTVWDPAAARSCSSAARPSDAVKGHLAERRWCVPPLMQ